MIILPIPSQENAYHTFIAIPVAVALRPRLLFKGGTRVDSAVKQGRLCI